VIEGEMRRASDDHLPVDGVGARMSGILASGRSTRHLDGPDKTDRSPRSAPDKASPRTPRSAPDKASPRTPRSAPDKASPRTPRSAPDKASSRTPRSAPDKASPRTPPPGSKGVESGTACSKLLDSPPTSNKRGEGAASGSALHATSSAGSGEVPSKIARNATASTPMGSGGEVPSKIARSATASTPVVAPAGGASVDSATVKPQRSGSLFSIIGTTAKTLRQKFSTKEDTSTSQVSDWSPADRRSVTQLGILLLVSR
jgi:hypothetical protein